MAVRVAIVEDDQTASKTLSDYLLRYAEENHITFRIKAFDNAISMLNNYTAEYDIIFMDIRMPYINGMDAAHKLRALDQKVLLIFVTSLTQYAIEGYEVNALNYIVKPVNYYDFALKLSRAVSRVPQTSGSQLVITTKTGVIRLNPEDIRYVESEGHHLIFHTLDGEYTQYSSLSKLEEKLLKYDFVRCNSCYLMNPRFVRNVKGYTAILDNCELKISQPRKKSFVQALDYYWAEHPESIPDAR